MSEFDIFTIDTKLTQNTNKLQKLKRTKTKITTNQQLIQLKSVQRVNKVAMFTVTIPHTSEYLLKLGNEYYAKVKAKTAVQILDTRIKHLQEENKKWEQLKTKLVKNAEQIKKQNQHVSSQNNSNKRDGKFESSVEVIGQNEDGQQIVNIVQFQQDFSGNGNGDQSDEQNKQIIQQQEQQQQQTEQKQKEIVKPQIQTKVSQQLPKQNIIQKVQKQTITESQAQENLKKIKFVQMPIQEKPKKISKFKAERMQMKQK